MVGVDVPAGRVQDLVASHRLVNRVELFDVYTGENVAPGTKSLAFHVYFQSSERTLTAEPYKRRTLRTYNVSNTSWELFERFQFTAYQLYEDLGNGTTRLTFEGDLDDHTKYSVFEHFVFWVSQFEGERVFRLNLENIKAMIEQKDAFERPHPWEPNSPFDA